MTTTAPREETTTPVVAAPRHGTALAVVTAPALWLALYIAGLAAIAFWPVPVDRDSGALLDAITAVIPWLTYTRIEILANILLFLPFGFLLASALRGRAVLTLAIAVSLSFVLEAGQAVFLPERTPSAVDVFANSLGALIGIALAWAIPRRRTR